MSTISLILLSEECADLGSHKPVRVGKRRPESTASIRSSNNPVTVIDYANYNHNPNHNPNHNYQCEPCRLCSSLTTANWVYENPYRFTQTREGTFYISIRRLGAWQIVGILRVGMRTGCRNTPRTYDRRGCLKKEDKYASGLMLRRTPDRALKNRTAL